MREMSDNRINRSAGKALIVGLALSVGLLLCLGGCNAYESAYDQIQVGKAAPERLDVEFQRSESGLSFTNRQTVLEHTFFMWEDVLAVQALTDAKGQVTAKQCVRETLRHAILMLVSTVSVRWSLEVELPPEYMKAPGGDVAAYVEQVIKSLQSVPTTYPKRRDRRNLVAVPAALGLKSLLVRSEAFAGIAEPHWQWRGVLEVQDYYTKKPMRVRILVKKLNGDCLRIEMFGEVAMPAGLPIMT